MLSSSVNVFIFPKYEPSIWDGNEIVNTCCWPFSPHYVHSAPCTSHAKLITVHACVSTKETESTTYSPSGAQSRTHARTHAHINTPRFKYSRPQSLTIVSSYDRSFKLYNGYYYFSNYHYAISLQNQDSGFIIIIITDLIFRNILNQ